MENKWGHIWRQAKTNTNIEWLREVSSLPIQDEAWRYYCTIGIANCERNACRKG